MGIKATNLGAHRFQVLLGSSRDQKIQKRHTTMLQILVQHPRRISAAVAFIAMSMLAFTVLFFSEHSGPATMPYVHRAT